MTKWKNIRNKYIKIEMIGIVLMVLCFGLGSCLDWNVIVNNNILISVDDIESFSLTVLQIQATVGTLIVAIIALITGNISDSYMGVSISDFYLNIKPWKLKQKVLIFISLGLCLLGVTFHCFGLYNLVFYLFIATLLAIGVSIIEIYSAFKGRNTQNQEIEAYINFMIESDVEYEKKLNIYQNFVSDWGKTANSQDKHSYEKYLEIFNKCILALWDYGTDEGLAFIQQQCYYMAYCFWGSDKNTIKERGIEFIQEIYSTLWSAIHKCILENKQISNQYKNGFTLFSEIQSELVKSMDDINAENIEKRIKFGNFTDLVQRVAIWTSANKEADKNDEREENEYQRYEYDYTSEIYGLVSFGKYMGYYLEKQQQKNHLINQQIWINVLNRWSMFSSYNVPKKRREEFLKSKVMIYFSYCYGMLMNRQDNIVKKGLYLTGMKNVVTLDNKQQALLYISVHCYIYYLAERESDYCVSESIKQSAINIWNDKDVREAFTSFLYRMSENTEWLNVDICDQVYEILDRYEMFPEDSYSKYMILEYVVSDFYLFLVLFMSHEFFLPELLENNIDDVRAFRYVSDGNEEETKKMFNGLFRKLFNGEKTEEQIRVEVDLMYDALEKKVKEKQKKRYINLASEAQEKYKETVNEEEICEKIKIDIINKINEKFSSILVDEDKKNGIIKIKLLNLHDYTNSLGERSIEGFYTHIDGMFLYGIEKFLYKRKNVELRNRFDDFENDNEFMEYLSANKYNLLLGSRAILKNRNYKQTAEYNKFLENYETIYTAIVNNGIALKKDAIKVCLHDVNVSIHSLRLEETKVEYDMETGQYRYPIMSGLPIEFEEDELREFLYNNRKVINVTAKVSIQVNEKLVGTIISGKKKV
mgnify:CR=1 FL=1